jgi:rubrerythrin
MTTLQTLRKKYQAHQRLAQEVPPETDQEKLIFKYTTYSIQLQIECEQYREGFRTAFHLCEHVSVNEIMGEYNVESTRTRFKWESVRDKFLMELKERELTGIGFYQTKIRELQNEQQKAI